MKNRLPMFLCLLVLPLLFSCSSPPNTTDQSNTVKPPKVANDEKTCLERDGEWMRAGLLGNHMCIFKASDAGKSCTDSKQCEYRCYGSPADKNTGQCQASSNPFGCHSEMINGVLQPGICVD